LTVNTLSTITGIQKRNMATIGNVFENVYPARRQIMIYCSATDLSTLCYAMKFELTEKEKEEFLKPIRDIPVQQDWIRAEVEKGTRISIVGSDVSVWLARIKDPEQYWNVFKQHPMLRIWIIARRGDEEMEEINNKKQHFVNLVRERLVHIMTHGINTASEVVDTWGESVDAYVKLSETDPKPPGNFLASEVYNFMYKGRAAIRSATESTTIPPHWSVCLDAVNDNIELLYTDTHMKMRTHLPGAPFTITNTDLPSGEIGCISLAKDVSKFYYLYPRDTMFDMSYVGMFDVSIRSNVMPNKRFIIRVGS